MAIDKSVERIKGIMGIITEGEVKYNQKSIFYGINGLGTWLHTNDGFGLANYINKVLEPLKSSIAPEDMAKYKEGASYLLQGGQINKGKHDWFIGTLESSKLVFVDGEWHPTNKLNTNYSQLATIVTELLIKSNDENDETASDILSVIDDNKGDIKTAMLDNKDFIYGLFKKYLSDPKDLLPYTDKITQWSEVGEGNEDLVANILTSKGYTVVYQGGNGDFIDMKFGIDLIVKSPKGKIQTIQVKTSERQATSFLRMSKRYAAVDFVTYKDTDGKMISKKVE